MRRTYSHIGFLVGLLLLLQINNESNAQSSRDSSSYSLQMLGRAQQKQILLRWAPNNSVAWAYFNKYGARLERYTITRDGKTMAIPERKTFDRIFKPLPQPEWERLADTDDYAAIVAEMLYSESIEVTESYSSDIISAINKVRERDQRFSLAMFAADHSVEAARAAGLSFTDIEVKPNEKYLYTLTSLTPSSVQRIDSAFVYIGLSDYFPLPVPEGIYADAQEKVVMISWLGRKFKDFYTSYIIEKSEDGKNYFPITDLPIINSLDERGEYPEYMFKADTVSQFNREYYYRVRGVNPFGEISEPSEVAKVTAFPSLHFTPHIIRTEVQLDGSMKIEWHYPPEGESITKGFKLLRSGEMKGQPEIVQDKLSPHVRQTIDTHPRSSNYYTIVAYGDPGIESASVPSLAMLEDSIPPIAPVKIAGKIDTLGVVSLQWQPNPEKDLAGYRVYRSNFSETEFVQVTVNPTTTAAFIDTINLKTLTHQVFYKIVAIDNHFNPSGFSEVLVLDRPDIIPPAPPQFGKVSSDSLGLHLEWTNSVSDDVKEHVIYYRTPLDSIWREAFRTPVSDHKNNYLFKPTLSSTNYAMTMVAIDRSGLESVPAQAVVLKSKPKIVSRLEHVTAKADRQRKVIVLSWRYQEQNVRKYLIYRAEEENVLALYKEINAPSNRFEDNNLKVDRKYRYRIQAELNNGTLSRFTDELSLNY